MPPKAKPNPPAANKKQHKDQHKDDPSQATETECINMLHRLAWNEKPLSPERLRLARVYLDRQIELHNDAIPEKKRSLLNPKREDIVPLFSKTEDGAGDDLHGRSYGTVFYWLYFKINDWIHEPQTKKYFHVIPGKGSHSELGNYIEGKPPLQHALYALREFMKQKNLIFELTQNPRNPGMFMIRPHSQVAPTHTAPLSKPKKERPSDADFEIEPYLKGPDETKEASSDIQPHDKTSDADFEIQPYLKRPAGKIATSSDMQPPNTTNTPNLPSDADFKIEPYLQTSHRSPQKSTSSHHQKSSPGTMKSPSFNQKASARNDLQKISEDLTLTQETFEELKMDVHDPHSRSNQSTPQKANAPQRSPQKGTPWHSQRGKDPSFFSHPEEKSNRSDNSKKAVASPEHTGKSPQKR